MNPLRCRHWLLHESKVDNLLIFFFQLGNCINRKAENDHNFLRMVWGKTQKKSVESLCDDSVFWSVTVRCFFSFFLNRPWFSYLQKNGENTSQYCNIYSECDILLHSGSQNGGMQQRRVQVERCVNGLQAFFPRFNTQHNTLSTCDDDMRTFTMQHRDFRWVSRQTGTERDSFLHLPINNTYPIP